MALTTILFSFAVVFGAYVVRGMSGFGTSLVAIPLLVFVLPIHSAIPVMSLLGLCAMLMLGLRDRGHVRWDEMWRLLGPTLAGVFAGIYIFMLLPASLMQKLLGAFIVTYAVYMLAARVSSGRPTQCSTTWAYPMGFAGSVIDSMFGGGGGLLVVIYMHRRGYHMVAFRATLAVLWLLELVVRVAGYAVSGFYNRELLLLCLMTLPAVVLGNLLGERITRRMSAAQFNKVIAIVLLASGISLLLK
jgi:uncharacterized membrane protein YfcA